jgi:hypothetical protein
MLQRYTHVRDDENAGQSTALMPVQQCPWIAPGAFLFQVWLFTIYSLLVFRVCVEGFGRSVSPLTRRVGGGGGGGGGVSIGSLSAIVHFSFSLGLGGEGSCPSRINLFGGGGHTVAAGFQISKSDLSKADEIIGKIKDYQKQFISPAK